MSLFDQAVFEEQEPLLWADLDDNPDRPPWETPESWAIEREKQVGNHFIEKCSCGAVLTQCFNPNKTVIVKKNGCTKCRDKAVTDAPSAPPKPPRDPNDLNFGPAEVDLTNHLQSTFGKFEIEDAAVKLIEYLTTIPPSNPLKNPWFFTLSGLISYYKVNDWDTNEALFGLMGSWFDDGGMMGVVPDPGYILHWGSGLGRPSGSVAVWVKTQPSLTSRVRAGCPGVLSMTNEFLKRISKYVR